MPTTRKKTVKAPDEQAVLSFLSDNPDFLVRHRDLLAHLATPARQLGDGVSDFQRFMVDRLKLQVQALRDSQQALLAAGRANDESLSRIHKTVLRLIEANTLAELGKIVSDELPALCGVDCAVLEMEGDGWPAPIICLEAGGVDANLGPAETMLRANVPESLGKIPNMDIVIRSIAIVRLEPDADTLGLLTFGSCDPECFTPDLGTDMVSFLAAVISRQIRKLKP